MAVLQDEKRPFKLKYEPREEQVKIKNFVIDSVQQGKKNILIDAPVGIGKSFAAMMIIDYFMTKKKLPKFDLITNSKILQSQYFEDFDFINNLWGANNYACNRYECSCETGKELAKLNQSKCEDCPYDEAKEWYFGGQVGLTNYHMFILYSLFLPHLYEARESRVLIVDEAHEMESVLCDFITIKLSKPILKLMGLPQALQIKYGSKFKAIKNMPQLVDLIENELIPDLEIHKKRIKKSELGKEELKRLERLEGNLTKYKFFVDKYEQDSNNWVLEIEDNKSNPNKNMNGVTELTVQPVWSGNFLKEYIWDRYDHVIMMSGTILDLDMFCHLNGMKPEETSYLSMNMPFPKNNRKIFYMPVAKMNYSNKHQAIEMYIPQIKKILKKNKDHKGIIHTVNYEIARWIQEKIQDDRLIFHDSSTRDLALRQHYASEDPTVLVSPSMFTGVDLKDDYSRFQLILKMPYPNLGSEKIKKRKDSMEEWYMWRTVADVVQAYGRSVRNYDDWAETWILDASFDSLLNYGSYYMPSWFHEAIYRVNI